MTAKVLFFTAGQGATVGEQADIDQLLAAAKPYDIQLRSASASSKFGERIEACDFVAGTIPAGYEAKAVLNPDDLPAVVLTDTQVVVDDADTLVVTAGTVTFDVTDSVLTGVLATNATHKVVANGDVLAAADGGSIAVAIVAGVATYTYTAP